MVAALLLSAPARADAVADFYSGRQIRIVSGSAPGEHTAGYEHLLARVMPRYIPGSPTMIVESQPGAGSLNAANSVFNVAPRDGTVLGTAHGFVPLMPLYAMPGPKFDAREFQYLGSLYSLTGLCIGMKRDGIATVDDLRAREVLVGTSGPGTEIITFYNTIQSMLGARLKVIRGYASSGDINLAMERGELQARCGISWGALKITQPAWSRGEVVNILMQLRLTRDPELANVPTLGEWVTDAGDRQALEVLLASAELGWPFFLPPRVPADRVAALRLAFANAVRDPEFISEAGKQNLDLSPTTGAAIQSLIARLYATPPSVLDRVRALAVQRDAP